MRSPQAEKKCGSPSASLDAPAQRCISVITLRHCAAPLPAIIAQRNMRMRIH
jgi:hypothetical protein